MDTPPASGIGWAHYEAERAANDRAAEEKAMMGIRPEKAGVRNRDHERGMILAVATIVVIAMLVMATPFLFKLSMQSRTTEKSNRSLAAFNLAEGGVDRALWEMNQPYAVSEGIVAVDEEGNGTIMTVYEEVGDRTGTIQGTITTNVGVEPNVRTIVATGGIPHIAGQPVTRTVSVNLEKYFKSIFDFGIFADEGIWGKTNIKTDSFNSNKAPTGLPSPAGGSTRGTTATPGPTPPGTRPSRSPRARAVRSTATWPPGSGRTRTTSPMSSASPPNPSSRKGASG